MNKLIEVDIDFLEKIGEIELLEIVGGREENSSIGGDNNPHCNNCHCNNCDC